jgi:hypothetical protein
MYCMKEKAVRSCYENSGELKLRSHDYSQNLIKSAVELGPDNEGFQQGMRNIRVWREDFAQNQETRRDVAKHGYNTMVEWRESMGNDVKSRLNC